MRVTFTIDLPDYFPEWAKRQVQAGAEAYMGQLTGLATRAAEQAADAFSRRWNADHEPRHYSVGRAGTTPLANEAAFWAAHESGQVDRDLTRALLQARVKVED